MNGLDFNDSAFEDNETSGRASRNKKRRWREIEAIKERQRLKRELEDIGLGFDDFEDLAYE